MFKNLLKKMREKIQTHQYVITIHAEAEMEDDRLTFFDIEHAILTGKIIKRQKHETGEWKYLIRGCSLAESEMMVVSQLSMTGELVIITVFLL